MRDPFLYNFNGLESHLISQTFHKQFGIGKILRGDSYLKAVENMLTQELITLTPIEKQEKGRKLGFKMQLTDKGKEAWNNFRRKAANLSPIVIENQ